jgi:hypothetical protein
MSLYPRSSLLPLSNKDISFPQRERGDFFHPRINPARKVAWEFCMLEKHMVEGNPSAIGGEVLSVWLQHSKPEVEATLTLPSVGWTLNKSLNLSEATCQSRMDIIPISQSCSES